MDEKPVAKLQVKNLKQVKEKNSWLAPRLVVASLECIFFFKNRYRDVLLAVRRNKKPSLIYDFVRVSPHFTF